MPHDTQLLASLVGSRICHDLANSVGALGNGFELLQHQIPNHSPELALMHTSLRATDARLRYFRLAFGLSQTQTPIGVQEILNLLNALHIGGRFQYHWQIETDLPRKEVQLLLLATLCVENAMVRGGTITMSARTTQFEINGTGRLVKWDASLWDPMPSASACPVAPDTVQFALFQNAMGDRPMTVAHDDHMISLRF